MGTFTGAKIADDDGYHPTEDKPFTPACQEVVVPKKNQTFLFLGDLIDGGHQSSHVLVFLYALKSVYPKNIYILRGRRESKTEWDDKGHSILLSVELEKRYETEWEGIYNACLDAFKWMPVAAIVCEKYWCASGGIGPGMTRVNELNRYEDSMKTSCLCDVVWGDPMDDEDEDIQSLALYLHNYEKGLAFNYSFNAVMHFLQEYKLTSIIRGVSFTDNRETPPQVSRQTHNSSGRPWHFQYSCYDPGYRLYRKSL
eukprot:TRINITY_DN816_c0_g1_i3.p1 TRINITY_DN816_c0_g1~~TRINITY_DN816_c0_g1_i3.p1  ORF type:complete len:255 (+),score=41.38 TRINITY_DN816_c0_g1_i3:130-894(+)